MANKFYEVGYMVKASEAKHDYKTIEIEGHYDKVGKARKRARELSRECPIPNSHHPEEPIIAIEVVCLEEETDYMDGCIHWDETYVNGKMVSKTNYDLICGY